jgi:maleylacetate reductase
MISSFSYDINPGRVLLGPGMLDAAAGEFERLGAKRPLILSTSFQRADALKLAGRLGAMAAGVFQRSSHAYIRGRHA